MSRQNAGRLLACAVALGAAAVAGCPSQPDSEQLGEIIIEVPPHLDKPIPLPELVEPAEAPQPAKKGE